MTAGQLLMVGLLGVSAFVLVRTILAAGRGKMRSSPITWAWIGVWSVAVAYGISSAALRFAKDGKPSTLLAFGVAVISVFCWVRMFRHLEASAARQNRERVVRGTQVVTGQVLQTSMHGSKARPADVDIEMAGWCFRAYWKRSTCCLQAPPGPERRKRSIASCALYVSAANAR